MSNSTENVTIIAKLFSYVVIMHNAIILPTNMQMSSLCSPSPPGCKDCLCSKITASQNIKNKLKLFNNTHVFDQIFRSNTSPFSADGSGFWLTDPLLELAVYGVLDRSTSGTRRLWCPRSWGF